MRLFTTSFRNAGALCITVFPLFWYIIGGGFRTPIMFFVSLLAILDLHLNRLSWRISRYGWCFGAGGALFLMGLMQAESESLLITPIWYILLALSAIPTGIALAHRCDDFSLKTALNWSFAALTLLLGLWSLFVMSQIDVSQIVRITGDTVQRGDQREVAELFWVFRWENLKMAIIPWCAYPFAALAGLGGRGSFPMKVMVFLGASLAIFVAGSFITRTVFFSGGIAVIIVLGVLLTKVEARKRFLFLVAFAVVIFIVLGLIKAIPAVDEAVTGLINRFSAAADDSRLYVWDDSVRLIWSNPFGGGDSFLADSLWAHNLPLDMGLLYGIPGLLSSTLLILLLVKSVATWVWRQRGLMELYEVTMLAMFIAALISSLISPPDLAYLAPLFLIGAFCGERSWILRRGGIAEDIEEDAPLTITSEVGGAN